MSRKAEEIDAKCQKCNWHGKLVECLSYSDLAMLHTRKNEKTPTCPICNEMVQW